jgi:2-polyprenyl-3-methyl-5-hydroxy-6-metoxy-1,4-benzoquinol methylase
VEHMNITHCPSCGQTQRSASLVVTDHMVSQEHFTVEFCSCGLGITTPRPDVIGPYYESPAYTSHSDSNAGLFGALYGLARNFASWQKVRLIRTTTKKTKGNLLDYGCGVGVFTSRAERNGWAVQGVELSEGARILAQQKLKKGKVVAHRSKLDETTYDAVTLFHVLEHLDDPTDVLTWVRERMNPGGALIIAVPNYESPDARHYGRYWAAWDVPIHYWHFSKSAMKHLAQSNGWFVESIRPMRLDAFYVGLLSESYKNGSKNWFSAIYQGLRSNILGGSHNASSLIYVLRKAA